MGNLFSLDTSVKNISKDIVEALKKLSDNFTRPIRDGIHTIEHTGDNITQIIKTAENGVVSIVRDGITIIKDTEQNIFKLATNIEKDLFRSIQIAELGVLQIGEDIQTNTFKTLRGVQSDITLAVDNFTDQFFSLARTFVKNGFNVLQFIAIIWAIVISYGIYQFGETFIEIFENLTVKVIEKGGLLSLL